jgi:uncharacterized membrane protein
MVKIKRIFNTFFRTLLKVNKFFSKEFLDEITKIIDKSEEQHGGQIQFVIERSLPISCILKNYTARDRALELFASLGVWDTEGNNGVMIYLLLSERNLEIIADRGIDRVAGERCWENICKDMESKLRNSDYENALKTGIEQITELLKAHYPKTSTECTELADKTVIL